MKKSDLVSYLGIKKYESKKLLSKNWVEEGRRQKFAVPAAASLW